ncbi:MAG: radical SAM protein [Clostridia bacterium]|nr:radical SAM protein [Clostridia bacterium]
MKASSFIKFALFGTTTILFKKRKPILATIILTDKCNLTCKHCAVNNINCKIYPYKSIVQEMHMLHKQGIRILFFCGGETFLWEDDGKNIRDLVVEAKKIGFLIVNVVTNGTFKIDLPEADLVLLSLDGAKENHNRIRGDTYDKIINNISNATSNNICLYMAINKINFNDIEEVSRISREQKNIRAVSFNFHTPYPNTEYLCLSVEEKKNACKRIECLIKQGYPIFNLKSAFKYIVNNSFRTPCYQCLVIEDGKQYICGRCVDIEGLCEKCGYFFAAEYAMVFDGNINVIIDMLRTYLKYI